MRSTAFALTLLAALVAPRAARATWSVVMVDRARGAAGVAVASCVPLDVLERVPVVVPGRGALVTQSYLYDPARPLAEAMLASGEAPSAIVAALTDPAFDPEASLRQYAIATLDGAGEGAYAQHTGPGALPFAGHDARAGARFVTLAQGNVLTSPAVLEGALAEGALAEDRGAPPCPLRRALVGRLVAATAGPTLEGDARCTPDGASAASALVVVDEGDGALVTRAFELDEGGDPVVALAAWSDALGHTGPPCPLERPPRSRPSAGPSAGPSADAAPEPGAPESRSGWGCAFASAPSRPGGPRALAALLGLVGLASLARRVRGAPRPTA